MTDEATDELILQSRREHTSAYALASRAFEALPDAVRAVHAATGQTQFPIAQPGARAREGDRAVDADGARRARKGGERRVMLERFSLRAQFLRTLVRFAAQAVKQSTPLVRSRRPLVTRLARLEPPRHPRQENAVKVRQHTAPSDRHTAEELVELWSLRTASVTCLGLIRFLLRSRQALRRLKDLCRQVLEDARRVHRGARADARRVAAELHLAVHAGHRELEAGLRRAQPATH